MMSVFKNTSLRILLIGGFLTCAFLTGLSGGVGIYSLGQIKTTMSQSTDSVVRNIGIQNIRIQQLIPARKLITQVSETSTIEDLSKISENFQKLEKSSPPAAEEIKAIYLAINDLVGYKHSQMSALNDLNQLKEQNVASLETITRLTINSVNTSVNESIEGIEKETQSIKKGFGGLLQSNKTVSDKDADLEKIFSKAGINDMMDELMMVSEMSISAVRAAMSVQSRANRQLVVVNDIFDANDLVSLEQASKEIERLQGEINSELVELPEDQTTTDITNHLKALSVFFGKMIGAKKTEIDTAAKLHNKLLDIRMLMRKVENSVLSDGKKLTDSVTEKMNSLGGNVSQWQFTQIVLVAVAIGLALCIGFIVSGIITTPINKTIAALKDIAQGNGDLTLRLDESASNEIGRMGRWFNVFIGKLQGIIKEIAGGVETASAFSKELSGISEKMTLSIQNVSDRSNTVSTAAEEMSANMNNVAAAMEQSATNTNMVATSSEEMSSTIGEIAQNAEKARGISDAAARKASNASTNMDQLGNAANSIGKVIETIAEISEQVNLLALNATIEAARAGEAGKGFAVVANEIKELAKQTAHATLNIREQIEGIQVTTTTTVDQISEITTVINDVNDVVATIATAVEEQSAATKEIANNVAQASQGIQEVNENVNQSSGVSNEISRDIAGVSESMNEMSTNSSQVNHSAQELAKLSSDLKQLVVQFNF
jgi:methyl-accepting chemotaxis protein